MKTFARTACVFFLVLLLPLKAGHAQSRPSLPLPVAKTLIKTLTKTLYVGESDVYEFDHMTAAAVGSPTVADIVPLSSRRLLVNAKGVGETTLFVYDRQGKHALRLAVLLRAPDLGAVAARVQTEIGLPDVTVRAVKDTLFLEGGVTSVVALQRASAIAGVYTPKLRNLITVLPIHDSALAPTLAQTYAALLTDNLVGTGVRVQIVDDKTIALLGQYAAHIKGPETAPEGHPSTRNRRAKRSTGPSKAETSTDTSEDALDESTPSASPKQASSKRGENGPPLDPLDRLIQSLPSELKVVDLINIGSHPTQQILVHAKIIELACTVSAEPPPGPPPPIGGPSPARPRSSGKGSRKTVSRGSGAAGGAPPAGPSRPGPESPGPESPARNPPARNPPARNPPALGSGARPAGPPAGRRCPRRPAGRRPGQPGCR